MTAESVHLLPIWDTIRLAWEKTKGTKKTIWAAFAVVFVFIVIFAITQAVLDALYPTSHSYLKLGVKLVFQIISYLFQMSILYIGIKRTFDLPIHYRMVFWGFRFHQAIKLIGLYLLEMVILIFIALPVFIIVMILNYLTNDMSKDFLVGILFFLLALAFIYVAMRMFLAPGFILDKELNPWKALILSFKSTRFNFWRLISINIIILFILAISFLPLGLGLIWTIPFMVVGYGVIYQRLSTNINLTSQGYRE